MKIKNVFIKFLKFLTKIIIFCWYFYLNYYKTKLINDMYRKDIVILVDIYMFINK